MESIENKRLKIEKKKEDLPENFLKQGLGSLFIAVNDVFERIQNGARTINFLDSLDDLYKQPEGNIVLLDITNEDYSANLDNIAYAKRIDEELCVIVKDILIEEYQMYLYNMYNIDGVIFDVDNIEDNNLEIILNLAKIMGIEMICSLNSIEDFNKIKKYDDMIRIIATNDNEILDKTPKDVFVLKGIGSNLNKGNTDLLITKEEKK